MPALDQCERQVIRAFDKADWVVTHHPYSIRTDKERKEYIYADLRLKQRKGRRNVIVAEVKCFAGRRLQLDQFYHAIGQYIGYRIALEMQGIKTPIFLAVPLTVHLTFF
ncbi:MAG: element excision factor XisH family protein [Chloroflexota bacterium]|nr:element excision factor XisH family protein [Chloroflexota bacterium]